MADDKKIRIGVDDSAVSGYENKLRQLATQTFGTMIRESRAYTTSAREVNKDLSRQISLLEKRNRLEKERWESEIRVGIQTGELSSREGKIRLAEVRAEKLEDKALIQEIKALREDINRNALKEIREDRISVEKSIAASKGVGKLDPSGDPLKNLKETIQQKHLQEINEKEVRQGGGVLNNFRQYGMLPVDFISSRNALGVAGGAATAAGGIAGKFGGAGGIMGMIAGVAIGRLIQTLGGSAENLENALGDWSRLGGGSVKAYDPKGFDVMALANQGLTISDFVRNRAQLEVGGRTRNFGESALNLMAISNGTMLSEQDVSGMVGLRRFGGGTVSGTANYFETYLKQTGQSMAVLPEIIQQFTTEARNIISQTGRVDTAQLANLMTTVGGQTGFQGDLLGTAVSTLGRGMQRSNNPVVQALQFRAARGAAGAGATLWDMEKMMANPLENPEYIQGVLTSLRDISGGGQGYERAISNVLGVNPNLAANYANIDLSKQLTKEQLLQLNESKVSFQGKSAKTEGWVGVSGKFMEGGREKIAFERAQEISKAMMDLVNKINDWIQNGTLVTDKLNEMMQENAKAAQRRDQLASEAAEALSNGNETRKAILREIIKQPMSPGYGISF